MMNPLLQRMGYSASDRVVIVHADDVGMCHASTALLDGLFATGVVVFAPFSSAAGGVGADGGGLVCRPPRCRCGGTLHAHQRMGDLSLADADRFAAQWPG